MWCSLFLAVFCCISFVDAVSVNQHYSATSSSDALSSESDQVSSMTALHMMVSHMVENQLRKPRMRDVMHKLASQVSLKSAAHRLQQKHLPHDVMALVKAASQGQHEAQGSFDESSLTKAREVLNDMVQSSQAELDRKIIECQTFKEANRGKFDQIEKDLSRIAAEISDLERLKLEANNGITKAKQDIIELKDTSRKALQEYKKQKAIDEADMQVKQNDLEVFQFILKFTKCQDAATLLLQAGHHHHHVNICQVHDQLVIDFGNKALQQKYERMMTPAARREISKVLGEVQALQARPASFLGVEEEPAEASTTVAPIISATIPVLEGETALNGQIKCPPTPSDCGILHDKMSLIWGNFKNQVDGLQQEIDRNDEDWANMKAEFQKQLEIYSNTITTLSAQLAEATANLNNKHEEQRAQYDEKLNVQTAYDEYMTKCKKRIELILYQDICAVVVVRNAVLMKSTICPTSEIIDCEVEDWIPGTCSVSCDDSCPHPGDIFGCGGWQTLQRRILVSPNVCGLECPELTYQKKCNQVKCPIDCIMSEWSEYSKCTKDCGSGVQQRTRSVMTNARNGGEFCDVPTEQRACNTGSCDRNCELADWTEWTPCSMACTPDAIEGEDAQTGFKKRIREVVLPIRGFGECPNPESSFRLQFEDCNTHACSGDEECYAVQDLVLAIDGSGSITRDNFEILKAYVVKLVRRYKGEVANMALMRVGLVQFGNGEISEDGTISPALKISPLISDIEDIETMVAHLQYLKGFTNMAQAFSVAEAMFTELGREDAQSAVLVITDGKSSFAYQTQQMVDKLEEKGIQRHFITIIEDEGEETDLMNKWASDPWWTNHIHIPGFVALQETNDTYVQKAVVMFCPDSQAPEVCHASIYQHAQFLGWAADFPEGSYNMAMMIGRGAPNDDMSSIKVWGSNCVATLYQHWDFSGYSVDYPEGWYDFRNFIRQGARNDDISSLRVWKETKDEVLEQVITQR